MSFSALQRAEIAEMRSWFSLLRAQEKVSVLFNEPKLPKFGGAGRAIVGLEDVSVLFNEPKLPKFQ